MNPTQAGNEAYDDDALEDLLGSLLTLFLKFCYIFVIQGWQGYFISVGGMSKIFDFYIFDVSFSILVLVFGSLILVFSSLPMNSPFES